MGEALILHHETLARGALPAGEGANCTLIPFRDVRVAAVFRSETAPHSARVAVLSTRDRDVSPEFTGLSDAERGGSEGDTEETVWGGSWSPDGRLLVVYGASDGKRDATVWVLTKNEWIDGQEGDRASGQEPLVVLRVDLRDALAKDAAWRAAKAASSRISGAFFHTNAPSRCFFVTQDGWIIKMEIEVATLLVQARSGARVGDPSSYIKMKSIVRLTNWHAGVTAVAFETRSSTLVLGGGLKNPSDELRAQGASSLSVWQVLAVDPYVELLDYTMVMGSRTVSTDTRVENADSGDQVSEIKSEGIVGKVRQSFLNPLKMLHGGVEDGSTLQGAIRHLSISPDGMFLGIVNQAGDFRIRQIDACADVVDWQQASCGNIEVSAAVDAIGWLGPLTMGFLTRDCMLAFGCLASSEDFVSDGEAIDENDRVPSHRTEGDIRIVYESLLCDDRLEQNDRRLVQELCMSVSDAEGDALPTRAFTMFEFSTVQSSTRIEWQISTLENSSVSAMVQSLIDKKQFRRALELVDIHRSRSRVAALEVDLDRVYQYMWTSYRAFATTDRILPQTDVLITEDPFQGHDFDEAMNWLNGVICDRKWVITQCLQVVATASLLHMKEILATGLRALLAANSGGEQGHNLNEDRATLLRYLYRVDTLNQLVIAELGEDDRRSFGDEQCFDGTVFATFRDASILDIACDFAKQGRVEALTVLFRRNAYNLLPHRTRILELLPASISPRVYRHLLPAIGPQSAEEWQFYTLESGQTEEFAITEISVVAENHSHDLDSEELRAFEECARKDPSHRRDEYALWFTHRMVELDSMYGQLENAYELGRCGRAGLLDAFANESGGSSRSSSATVSSTPFEEFLEHSDRFYTCVYELRLSTFKTLSLEDWSLLSLHDQFMAVVEEDYELVDTTIDVLLHRLRKVFLELRRHSFALDEVVSWLCQVLMSRRSSSGTRDSLKRLELCAQLIHQSSPAIQETERWIQDDARLLRTAIDIIFAASTPSDDEFDALREHHKIFVDQLWLIFQSLPERKPSDPPLISQLQVEVDGMEDFLVTMDVLSNYSVLTCPSELRKRVTTDDQERRPAAHSSFARELVDLVCVHGFQNGISWTTIWQDVLKLKTHIFGERVTQEGLLCILLRHMISLYRGEEENAAFLSESHELIVNWITANVDALQYPMDILLGEISRRIDEGKNEEASHIVALAQAILALPIVEETEAVQSVRLKFEAVMVQEKNCMKVRELLELLTYGAVKISHTALRELYAEIDRLDLVLQVFSSNPSNYRMSVKAQDWLRVELQLLPDAPLDIVLDGVMYLAHLLRIRPNHRTKLVLKAAHSALYCLEFDAAHRLASKVITESEAPTADIGEKGQELDEDLTLLLSLVLDLISSSSFRSWEKKIGLVKLLLTAKDLKVLEHPIVNLIFERVHVLEATQSLATELGLSENELEDRREHDKMHKLSAEEALLRELEIVVDLLREDSRTRKEDRDFVFRLLQKGFQLVFVLQAQSRTPMAPTPPITTSRPLDVAVSDTEIRRDEWISRVVPQLAKIAFEDAYSCLTGGDGDEWLSTVQIGFSYLLLLSQVTEGSPDPIERVWRDDVLKLCCQQSSGSDVLPLPDSGFRERERLLVQSFGQFFEFLAASSLASEATTNLTQLREHMEMFKTSRAAALDFVQNQPEFESDMFDDDLPDTTRLGRRGTMFTSFMALARECEALVHSQQKNQELEAVATFLNDDVDLEQFSVDPDYRLTTIRRMSTKKENISAAKDFASKYGIDEFECVLAYIWHAFFPEDEHTKSISRQEQLEQAFRGADDSGGIDFLEQALQRPVAFGEFLLQPGTGVFESLPGTDHVGVLLVLRSILECSKRVKDAGKATDSLLPLSKSSSDRVALLFMCLKRLKESSTTENDETPDFKLVCGARSTKELLGGAEDPEESRAVAVTAIAPFLTSKSIKMLTKVLQKLHQVNASAIVMVFLNEILSKIWHEQQLRGIIPNSDLATYAYEACVPFLSVLTSEHLLIFFRRFVKCDETTRVSSHFYGQELLEMTRFGSLLSSVKRAEVISEHLTILQPRANALNSTDSQLLRGQEQELVAAAFWFVVDSVSENNLFDAVEGTQVDSGSWLNGWRARLEGWFALDPLQKTHQEDHILNAFVIFCERAVPLDLATLAIELALGLTSSREFVARAVEDIYCKGVSDVIHKALNREGGEGVVDDLVAHWATSLVASVNEPTSESAEELKQYIASLEPKAASSATPAKSVLNDVYLQVLNQLESLTSPLIRDIVIKRREKMSTSGDESSSLRNAVISQWKAVIAQYEEQKKWMTSAFLSHVLIQSATFEEEDRKLDFGLRVKAVCERLSRHHQSDSWSEVLSVPTPEVFSTFEFQVFDKLLAIIKSFTSSATHSSKHVTVASAALVRAYSELKGSYDPSTAQGAWRHEKEAALLMRLRGDELVDTKGTASGQEPERLWAALLIHGIWDERLMQWYTFVAYDKLSTPDPIAEYVRIRGDASPALTIMLLLVCPYQSLRDQHEAHILANAKQQLLSSSTSEATKARLLELLLLRFDLEVLLGVDGFEAALRTFHLEPPPVVNKTKLLSWTSTAEYYVCRLVLLREYAAAGRLVCAIWNAHPMLWDLENARLVLGNYLADLAKRSSKSSSVIGDAVRQARTLAYEHYQRELL